MKSLVWFPLPTIVKGLLANFCARKTPNTAPYAPEVLDLGPYALKKRKEIAGKLYILAQCIINSYACNFVKAYGYIGFIFASSLIGNLFGIP